MNGDDCFIQFKSYVDYDEEHRIYSRLSGNISRYPKYPLYEYHCEDMGRYWVYTRSGEAVAQRKAALEAIRAAEEEEHRTTIDFYHPDVAPSWWDENLTPHKLEQMFGAKVRCIIGARPRVVLPCYLNTKANRDKVNALLR